MVVSLSDFRVSRKSFRHPTSQFRFHVYQDLPVKRISSWQYARVFFSAAAQIPLTRHRQPSVTHVRTRKSERNGRRKREETRASEERTYFREKGFRGNVGRAGKSWISWRGDRPCVFEDDHQCGGREEKREITSMDRGMKRSSQIFTVSGWNGVSLVRARQGALKDELLQRNVTTDFDSLCDRHMEGGRVENECSGKGLRNTVESGEKRA